MGKIKLTRKHGLQFLIAVLFYVLLIDKALVIQNESMRYALFVYSFLAGLFLVSRVVLSELYSDYHKRHVKMAYPSVSVIIACKNEEASIKKTVAGIFKSSYPGRLTIVVVDDGSTDNTYQRLKELKQRHKKDLQIIRFKTNRGKREAMAAGVLRSSSDFLVFIDSDSFVKRNSIKHIIQHFLDDDGIGAASGNSLVENAGRNLLTKMQAARYGISFEIFKTAESLFGAVTCCPGCFSAYRKQAVIEILSEWRQQTFWGSRSTFGDDRSLTAHVLKNWKVVYCRKAVATTIVPDRWPKFLKQQLRWKKSWLREGMNTARVMTRKHVLAALSFYINLVLPIAGPFIVSGMLLTWLWQGHAPILFIFGLTLMNLLFGLQAVSLKANKYWFYIVPFALTYSFFLIWQMPYALIKIRDTKWGTR